MSSERPVTSVCRLDELRDGMACEFPFERNGQVYSGFVVFRGGQVHGYRNACPHLGAPLNWQPNRFLDADNRYIVCAMHGAVFRIEDGLCIAGPCYGQELEKLAVRVGPEGRIVAEI